VTRARAQLRKQQPHEAGLGNVIPLRKRKGFNGREPRREAGDRKAVSGVSSTKEYTTFPRFLEKAALIPWSIVDSAETLTLSMKRGEPMVSIKTRRKLVGCSANT